MQIGTRIVELRKQQGLSTNKLANLAGVSQSYLRDIELGNKNPTIEILSFLCDALHCSLRDFFSEEDATISPSLTSAIAKLNLDEQNALAALIHTMKSE